VAPDGTGGILERVPDGAMNWLARTGQRWKLRVGFALLAAVGICFVLGVRGFSKCEGPAYVPCATDDFATACMLVGTFLGILELLWVSLSVRCARCGKRVVWWAMSTQPSGAWLSTLTMLQVCPGCGDGAGDTPPTESGH
jgi:hypothetical protein